jgi:hypothetical protein
MTIPNDNVTEVVKIKTPIEKQFIRENSGIKLILTRWFVQPLINFPFADSRSDIILNFTR